MESKFNTITFCEDDYKRYYDYSHQEEVDYIAMWDDIKEFIRIAVKNGYQLKVLSIERTVIIEYNYRDETFGGVSLEWLGEDEYVANASPEAEK